MRRFSKRESEEPTFVNLYGADLSPHPYFAMRFEVNGAKDFPLKEKHHLPLPFENSPRHNLYIGWSVDGLYIAVSYPKKRFEIDPQNPKRGDCIELFFDTRDQKSSHIITPFCHHFLFTPEPIHGLFGKEITRFRGDESHDLANPHDFKVSKNKDLIQIFIPSHALYHFDPQEFKRLGFNAVIHQADEEPLKLTSEAPNHWVSLSLI